MTINKSKPPFGGEFSNTTTLDEGTTVQPGETLTESVTFAPTATGAASGTWQITGDDSTGLHVVQFSGTGVTLLGGSGLTFGSTTVGQSSSPQTLTVTANKALTVQSVASTSGQFTLGTLSPALPATLTKGGTISIPVTFSPTAVGAQSGQINVTTSAGSQSFSVSGTGQPPPPKLTVDQSSISFGSAVTGSHATRTVKYTNTGGQTLTISAVHAPSAPFSLTGAPATGSTIAPGSSVTVTVNFDPTAAGTFSGSVGLDSDGGNVSTSLSASAVTPGALQVTPTSIGYGSVVTGDTASNSFTVKNTGGTTVTITASTPPSGHGFAATTTLSTGATIAPGATATESVTFSPTSTGAASDSWTITGDDASGPHTVQFSGTGVTPLNGSGLTFPTTTVGQSSQQTLTLTTNKALTVTGASSNAAAFTVGTATPTIPASLVNGGAIAIPVTFTPTAAGSASGQITVTTSAGSQTFSVSGSAVTPGQLLITPTSIDFGTVAVTEAPTNSFTVKNTGGTVVTINTSTPPSGQGFSATTTLNAGATIQPGASVQETVKFAPSATGAASGSWQITGNDSTGTHTVQLNGTGIPLLGGAGLTFGTTTVGQTSSPQTLTLTANKALTVQTIAPTGPFAKGTPSQTLPASLAKGATLSIPMTFSPTGAGAGSGQVTVTTSVGSQSFSLSGTGQLAPSQLTVDQSSVAFGTAVVGSPVTKAVKFTNTGGQTLTLSAVTTPSTPFTGTDAPGSGATIAAGASLTVHVKFDPSTAGSYSDALELDSDGGNISVGLSGSAVTPGQLLLTPTSIDFGSVALTDSATQSFTVKNTGGTVVTISNSTPPSGQGFAATTTISAGATIQPGASVQETVRFAPTATGAASGSWKITGDDSTGTHTVQLTGTALPLLTGSGPAFGTTTVGQSSQQTLTLTANTDLSVTAIDTTGPFSVGPSPPSLPTNVAKGSTISIPVVFSPTDSGAASGQVNVTTDVGSQAVSLSGTGLLAPPVLTVDQGSVSFGPVTIGSPASTAVTFTNTGRQTLTLGAVKTPDQPFTATDAPAAGATLAANGGSVTIHVKFDPSSTVPYADALELDSDGGNVSVGLSGSGASQTTASSTTESFTSATSSTTATSTTTTTTTTTTTHRPTVKVPAAPKLLPAIATTTQLSSIYISYAATAVATAKFTLQRETSGRVQRVTHGRKVTRSCAQATGNVPRSERCTRYITIGSFSHRDRIGKTRIRVTSGVSWRKLVPGIYRLSSVLFDTAGAKHTFYATLRVNLPPKHPPRHNRPR